jgi:hypothetical protein
VYMDMSQCPSVVDLCSSHTICPIRCIKFQLDKMNIDLTDVLKGCRRPFETCQSIHHLKE